MEDAGRIRRGYFVDGLGRRAVRAEPARWTGCGPSARDRIRPPTARSVVLLAAADPANPYGAALSWPRRGETDRRPYQRAAGAYVVLVDGIAALYLDRGGSSIQVLPAADEPDVAVVAARSLRTLVLDGRVRELVIRKVDGEDVARLPVPADAARGRVRGRLPRACCSVAIARGVPGPRPTSSAR